MTEEKQASRTVSTAKDGIFTEIFPGVWRNEAGDLYNVGDYCLSRGENVLFDPDRDAYCTPVEGAEPGEDEFPTEIAIEMISSGDVVLCGESELGRWYEVSEKLAARIEQAYARGESF